MDVHSPDSDAEGGTVDSDEEENDEKKEKKSTASWVHRQNTNGK